jgi:hypothetical protein
VVIPALHNENEILKSRARAIFMAGFSQGSTSSAPCSVEYYEQFHCLRVGSAFPLQRKVGSHINNYKCPIESDIGLLWRKGTCRIDFRKIAPHYFRRRDSPFDKIFVKVGPLGRPSTIISHFDDCSSSFRNFFVSVLVR